MVWGEVKTIEEVRSQDRLTDVGDDKRKVESAVADEDLSVGESVTGDV